MQLQKLIKKYEDKQPEIVFVTYTHKLLAELGDQFGHNR